MDLLTKIKETSKITIGLHLVLGEVLTITYPEIGAYGEVRKC